MGRKLQPHRKGTPPLSADVEAHIRRVRKAHPDIVRVSRVIRSVRGRPIYAVTVTDDTVGDADKQNVLIVGGQHGNEESGRIVALALIDWLTTRAAAATRRKQKIVVMPNVNPDAAESDGHGNVHGVHPNLDHAPAGPRTPEGKAVEIVAWKLQPEVYVDLHACGGVGCGTDLVLYPPTKSWTQDDYFLHRIADDMVRAGERAGIPQTTFPLEWWGAMPPDGPSSTTFHYRNFKSIVFLTENTESNTHAYSVRDRARAGLAKIKALLAWGNRRFGKLYYPGYPCMLAGGTFDRGLMAVGRTAAQRRRSRVAIWKNIHAFKTLNYDIPQKPTEKTVRLEYVGERLKTGVGVQTSARGRLKVARVTLDGRALKPSETGGCYSWTDGCSTFTVVVIADCRPGKYVMEVACE